MSRRKAVDEKLTEIHRDIQRQLDLLMGVQDFETSQARQSLAVAMEKIELAQKWLNHWPEEVAQ